jgi:hypothetical protein
MKSTSSQRCRSCGEPSTVRLMAQIVHKGRRDGVSSGNGKFIRGITRSLCAACAKRVLERLDQELARP